MGKDEALSMVLKNVVVPGGGHYQGFNPILDKLRQEEMMRLSTIFHFSFWNTLVVCRKKRRIRISSYVHLAIEIKNVIFRQCIQKKEIF